KIKPCSPAEVGEEIEKLKSRKCPGKDRITNLMLKHLPQRTIVRITYLINCIIKLSHFPKSWKTAVVVPIYKPGKNAQSPDSYRPISLLSSLSKLAESIILNRLEAETEDKLIPFQFGFRKGLSTTEQLLRMTEHIREGFNNYFDTAAVFIDIAKAFDRVWIDGLIYKLHKLKISKQMILLIQSYLKNREFVVRVGNELSTPRTTEAGVVQGSRLGPHCFNIFINDICQMLDTQICLFSDDTAIMCMGPVKHINVEKLNNHLAELEKWLIKWKIKINKDKCQAMYFTKAKKLPPPPKKLFRRAIPWCSEVKYLGITLDKQLTFKKHISNIKAKLKTSRAILMPLIGKKSKLSLGNRLLLYKSMLRPLISYASPVWGAAAKVHMQTLERLQNLTVRLIARQPWYIRNNNIRKDLCLPTIQKHFQRIAEKAFRKVDASDNTAIQNIPAYDPRSNRNSRRPRAARPGKLPPPPPGYFLLHPLRLTVFASEACLPIR
ncbi:RNA-directed DNA polymerase from mobile element jockey, partial [Araneus ventricosus]